ncbi:zonular occludens toxin [Acidovorax sp. SUPP3434]|nr:zonular occludens toxin [Acidovorax sp. SUPP3434]
MLADVAKGRQLFVNGIPDLKIEHEELAEPERWHELVPDGAVIVIDEVQRVWRPRGPGVKVPDHVAKLETHRHRGLDFYIITQGPNLIDSNVRALVGRHVHLRELGILGRWWYEWPECADNCRTAWKNAPIKKRYRLPKHVFGQYKSASVHIKPIRSVPWMLAVAVLALVGVVVMTWRVYGSISAKVNPPAPAPAPVVAAAGPAAVVPQAQSVGAAVAMVQPLPDERVDFIPRLSDRPWTAPAYDHLRKVVVMPVITGAMCIDGVCKCYAGAARLLDVSSEACNQWRIDRPFNPYVQSVPVDIASRNTSSEPDQKQPVPGSS